MEIHSPAFDHGGEIPVKYAVEGENINPPLTFSDIPLNTKTLALLVDDPDVPKSIRPDWLWTHWIIWNMPPDISEILEGEVPTGVVGKNGRWMYTYGWPNPPDGWHRYYFRLYAIDREIDIHPETMDRTLFLKTIQDHIIASAELVGRYCKMENR